MKYKPDQSDRNALKVARVRGIRITKATDGTWAWSYQGVGNCDFATQYHAARDALAGIVKEVE